MSHTCNLCETRWEDPPELVYIITPCCNTLLPLSQTRDSIAGMIDKQFSISDDTRLRAKDIDIFLQTGKIESRSTVRKRLKNHQSRLRNLETHTEGFDDRLTRLERLVRIALGWECPDCQGELVIVDSGKMECQQCTNVFPTHPSLDEA